MEEKFEMNKISEQNILIRETNSQFEHRQSCFHSTNFVHLDRVGLWFNDISKGQEKGQDASMHPRALERFASTSQHGHEYLRFSVHHRPVPYRPSFLFTASNR